MKEILLPFTSRKFISAHFGVLCVFIIALISKHGGLDSGVAIACVGAITTLLTAYQAGNTIAKKYEGSDGTPK